MAHHPDSRHGRDTADNPTGRGRRYTQVSSRLHGAGQDVSKLLDLLTAGVAADESTAASRVAGEGVGPDDRRHASGARGDAR